MKLGNTGDQGEMIVGVPAGITFGEPTAEYRSGRRARDKFVGVS